MWYGITKKGISAYLHSPPRLPRNKGERLKRWKVKGGRHYIKSKKQVMQYTYPLYWNLLSFSFIIIEFSLDISFRVAMQPHLSPCKGEKERGWLIPNWRKSITSCLFITCLSSNAARLFPCKGEMERRFVHILLFYNCGVSHFFTLSPFHFSTFISCFQIVTFLTFENTSRFLFSLQIAFSI